MFDEGEDELLHEIDVLTNVCKCYSIYETKFCLTFC